MARYSYDVNTRTRLIDVYKQFNRGLKTVDTDDSLGSVFLRQAENVSLSEFGFIEKRYGTIQKQTIKTTTGTLQGYWEYLGFSIYVIDNKFYYNNDSGNSIPLSTVIKETEDSDAPDTIYGKDWRYPTNLPSYGISGFGAATEANPYRDMGAVNINNVLYVFTGFYPVYIKIVSGAPRLYWFSVTIPTYDEIVVTGHNLLEDDYNAVYYKNRSDIQYATPGVSTSTYATLTADLDKPPFFVVQKDSDDVEIKQHAPQIAYQDGGELDFNFKYVINPDYLEEYDSGTQDRIFVLDIDSFGYRTTGAGALNYTNADKDSIDFRRLHNYTGSSNLTAVFEDPLIDRKTLVDQSINGTNAFNNNTEIGIKYFNFTASTGGGGVFDLNTEKNGADFVSEANFKVGEVYEFQLRGEDLSNSSNPYPVVKIPRNVANFFDNFTNVPSSAYLGNATVFSSVTPKIVITPVDAQGNEFINEKIVLTLGDRLEETTTGYKFTVPSNLPDALSIVGYNISLRAETVINSTVTGSYIVDTYSVFTKELVKIEELESGTENNLTTSTNIGVKLKNLLAGTYDFRLRYRLTKYTKNSSNFLEFVNEDDGVEFADVFFFNIPITAEKLQDLPGQTEDFLPKLKPIWSCNKVMEHYGKLMVWGSEDETNGMPTAVFYSFPDRPTYFPSKFYLDFTNDKNEKIEAVTPYMNILVAQTASKTWGIRGNSGLVNSPAPYTPFSINGTVGTIAYKSVRPVRNHLFFLSKQGVIALKSLYAADEQYNIEFVDRNIRNIVPQDSKAVGIQFDNQYWLNFPLLNSTKESITLRWYIDKKAWVKDVYQGYATDGFKGVFKYQIVDGKLEFISHPSETADVNNLTIYRIGVDYSIPTDLFQPIKAKFETSFLNQNYPFHPKNYKEAKLDFTLQNEYNKGRLAIFDSSVEGITTTFAAQSISFTLGEGIKLEKNHRYRIDFFLNPTTNSETGVVTYTPVNVTDIQIEGSNTYVHDDVSLNTADNKIIATEFMLTNDDIATSGNIDLVFTHNSNSTASPSPGSYVSLRDVTYDDSLTFSTYIISEDRTLNFENFSGYDQATADVGVDLTAKERLGDWTFGTSDFGKKITAVKTIKLSGKGYNSKLYLEDTSKSKWTLESMGITYKMKRARSR